MGVHPFDARFNRRMMHDNQRRRLVVLVETRAQPRRARLAKGTAMAAGVGWAFWLGLDPRIIAVQALTCTAIGAWLVTRPEA